MADNNFIEDMEAGEMLLWLTIIGLAIYFLFFWGGGGILADLEAAPGGIWNGIVNFFKTGQLSTLDPSDPSAPGNELSSSENAAETWNTQYAAQRNPGANPFDPAIFNSNPSSANIDQATAQSIANTVNSQGGSFFTSGDMTGVQSAFQNSCQTWIDVSMVANAFLASESQDMLTYMISNFNNGNGASSNNGQQLQQFIQWATGLPQS